MPADTDPPDDAVALSVDSADGAVSALVCVVLVLECVAPVSAGSDCCAASSPGETGDVTVSLLWRAIDGSVRQIEAVLRKSWCGVDVFRAARCPGDRYPSQGRNALGGTLLSYGGVPD